MYDVQHTAWAAAGRPLAPADTTPLPDGRCARCATQGPLTRASRAISKSFTAFDDWVHPTEGGLCATCSWAYRTTSLRQQPHLVTAAGALHQLATHELLDHLRSPLPSTVALVVPLRPGRKHLITRAHWGAVTTDDTNLRWTAADVRRLEAMLRLRHQGFGPRMLQATAPPWQPFRRLSAVARATVLTDWPELDPWRGRRPWLDLALYATTPTTSSRRTSPTTPMESR